MGKIVKFKFLKIDAKISEDLIGEVSINNHVSIKELKQDENVLELIFEYSSKYSKDNKDLAIITFGGLIGYSDEKAKIDGYVKDWAKDKKLPKEAMSPMLNFVLTKCNIESLKVSQVLNLPSPIPLPEVKVQ